MTYARCDVHMIELEKNESCPECIAELRSSDTVDSLVVPMICPHCGWQGTDDDVKIEWERTPNGIKVTNGIKWTCPGCEMVVHDEEDYVTYCACGKVMGEGQICSYCRAVRDRDNAPGHVSARSAAEGR